MRNAKRGFIEVGLLAFYVVAGLFGYAAVHSSAAGKSAQLEQPAAVVASVK